MAEREKYQVVWPQGKRINNQLMAASRLQTLEGKTICELWNWNYHGEKIFPMIEAELTKRYPGVKFVNYRTFGSIHGAGEAKVLTDLREKLKQAGCDAVITGMGC